MSTSISYLYHILCNILIFNMVYFRGGKYKSKCWISLSEIQHLLYVRGKI